jgi:hypothetical protein
LAQRERTEMFGRLLRSSVLRSSVLEHVVSGIFCLAAVNLLAVLTTGGYQVAIGPFVVSAHHLRTPLLLLLALGITQVWLRGERRGIPSAARLRSPLLLFYTVVLIYSLNGMTLGSGDTVPARYLPLSLLRERNFDLDEFPFLYEPLVPYFLQRLNDHLVSTYPPWAAVLALPLYVLPILGGISSHTPFLAELEKASATFITACSVVVLFFAVRRVTRETLAWWVAVIYALATSSWSTSSQALWQHGPSQLFVALLLYCLLRGLHEPRFMGYAGLPLSCAIVVRPVNLVVALPISTYILWHHRRQSGVFLLAIFPPLLLAMAYNYSYFGSPWMTGFAAMSVNPATVWRVAPSVFTTPLFQGLLGVLGSPGRGLLLYSPIFLFSFVGIAMVWRARNRVLLKYVSLAPLLYILLVAKWRYWEGGGSYGPRLLADLTPLLCLYLYPPMERSQAAPLLKWALIGLVTLSIGFHALGVFSPGNRTVQPWSWADSPPVCYGRMVRTEVRQAVAHLERMIWEIPTSRDVPRQLAATYHLAKLVPGRTINPDAALILSVTARNIGEAVWLARSKGDRGAVRLAWRWFQAHQDSPLGEGRAPLPYDIRPGEAAVLTTAITSPHQPGEYRLEVGLLSEYVTWFSAQGVTPLQVPIHVFSPDVNTLLTTKLQAIDDHPYLAIAVDQPHYQRNDLLLLTVDLVNTAARTVDIYVILEAPNGVLSFWNGGGFSPYTGERGVPMARGVDLAEGARVTGFPLLFGRPVDLPAGAYALSLVLTESNSPHVIARAQATFTVEP